MRNQNPSPIEIKAVIFDLDGTLVDTEPSAAEAIRDCFRDWKISVVAEDAHYITGRTWENAFHYLFSKYRIDLPRSEAEQAILRTYQKKIHADLHRVPGSAAAVVALAKKFPLALVSGSHREDVIWALKELQVFDLFKVVLGAEDYPKSKPSPDGYLKAMKQLDVLPENCLVFEDSSAGIASARNAGAWVVGIRATNHFNQDTTDADWHVENLVGIDIPWVEKLKIRK